MLHCHTPARPNNRKLSASHIRTHSLYCTYILLFLFMFVSYSILLFIMEVIYSNLIQSNVYRNVFPFSILLLPVWTNWGRKNMYKQMDFGAWYEAVPWAHIVRSLDFVIFLINRYLNLGTELNFSILEIQQISSSDRLNGWIIQIPFQRAWKSKIGLALRLCDCAVWSCRPGNVAVFEPVHFLQRPH